jgi:hypothetical protein
MKKRKNASVRLAIGDVYFLRFFFVFFFFGISFVSEAASARAAGIRF